MDSPDVLKPMWVCELQREMQLRQDRYFDRMDGIEKTLDVAVKTAKLAVDKAEVAANERFEAANNVKSEMGAQLSALMPRQEITARMEAVEKSIDELTKVVTTMTGKGLGVKDSWGFLVGAAGLGALTLSAVLSLVAH